MHPDLRGQLISAEDMYQETVQSIINRKKDFAKTELYKKIKEACQKAAAEYKFGASIHLEEFPPQEYLRILRVACGFEIQLNQVADYWVMYIHWSKAQ